MSRNIGLLFYKEYFNGLHFDTNSGDAKMDNSCNKTLFDLNLNNYISSTNKENIATHSIDDLSTIYPGLLIGSGYAHEIGSKEIENELKLGFFFDHTTGLPCIPSSSVKGVLRDACEKAEGHYIEYILTELANETRQSGCKETATNFLENFKESIFVQNKKKISKFIEHVFECENVNVYHRDIFFDAFPIRSANEGGKFLANDYITHHENTLKNPNPIQFLKVLPQVNFRFDFKLTDKIMPATLKLELFRQILLDLGIGAKTNVGYGQFKILKIKDK